MKTKELLAILAVVAGLAFILKSYLDLPVVQVNHLTGECVRVLDPDNKYSCARLPGRYIVQHVQEKTENDRPENQRATGRIERPVSRSQARAVHQNWQGAVPGGRPSARHARWWGIRYF